jgi:hypothetical protein
MQPTAASYPATFTFDPPEKVANWRPLVNWLLAIPHFIVLYGIGIVSNAAAIIGWFAIVFTGRLPEGLGKIQALYIRYYTRTQVYTAFMREEYPPFSFDASAADPGDDPRIRVDLGIETEDRNRLTTAFRWILVLPHALILGFLGIAVFFVSVLAFFAVLFTGKWPPGMRDFALGFGRWLVRFAAYALLLTDDYPPFSLD